MRCPLVPDVPRPPRGEDIMSEPTHPMSMPSTHTTLSQKINKKPPTPAPLFLFSADVCFRSMLPGSSIFFPPFSQPHFLIITLGAPALWPPCVTLSLPPAALCSSQVKWKATSASFPHNYAHHPSSLTSISGPVSPVPVCPSFSAIPVSHSRGRETST